MELKWGQNCKLLFKYCCKTNIIFIFHCESSWCLSNTPSFILLRGAPFLAGLRLRENEISLHPAFQTRPGYQTQTSQTNSFSACSNESTEHQPVSQSVHRCKSLLSTITQSSSFTALLPPQACQALPNSYFCVSKPDRNLLKLHPVKYLITTEDLR